MPVLRQEVNTGDGILRIGDVNYMVGSATPQVQQVQPEGDTRGAAIQGFLSGFLREFEPKLGKAQVSASAQGQIDATQEIDALGKSKEYIDKQNIFIRDAYQRGYLGAAVQQSVTDFQAGAVARAQESGLKGMSDDDFLKQERQNNASLLGSLSQYLPHMDDKTVQAVVQSLDNTRASTLNMLRKSRLGQAKIMNIRSIEQGSNAAQYSFLQSLQIDGFDSSYHYLEDHLNMIGSNPLLDEKEKRDQISSLFVTTAQNINNPDDINRLADKAYGVLGVTGKDTYAALMTQYKRAGEQQQGTTLMDLTNRMNDIGKMPAYQQADAKYNLELSLVQAQRTNRISTGQMMDMYNKLHKEEAPKLQLRGMIDVVAKNGGSLSVESLHASNPKFSYSDIQSAIKEAFPNTPDGNRKLLAAGAAGNDPWMVKTALSRTGQQMADQLDTLSVVMKPTTDENGNTVYNIPQAVQDNVVSFMGMYSNADAITRQTLLNALPADWQGVIASAVEQDPQNANNNVLDTIKRVQAEKASGLFTDVSANPPEKALDTDAALSWYQRINPFTTDSERSQRAALAQQLRAEYDRLYKTNRGLLSGKSPETINKMLVGNIQARTVPLQVGKFTSNVTLPAGTTLDSYAQAAGVDASTFQLAMQKTVDSTLRAQGYNPDLMDSVTINPNTGGSQTRDFTMTVFTKNDAGQYIASHIALPMNVISRTAKSDYDALISKQRADGTAQAGTAIATFRDYKRGGMQTIPVSGPNRAGMDPAAFNEMLANTMMYEGFRAEKGNGSVGYGWHNSSGDSVPDRITQPEAQAKLKQLYEERYVPMARSYIKESGLSGDVDSVLPMLADLTYQRPADAKALVNVMAKMQRHEATYPDVVNTLKSLPSYKDAGGGDGTIRNRDRLQRLYVWASLDGSRATDPNQNPVAALSNRIGK